MDGLASTVSLTADPSIISSRSSIVIDPRLLQITVLGGLLCLACLRYQSGASAGQLAVTLAAALATQAFGDHFSGRRADWRSPAITSLSLTLLLRTHDPLLWAASGAIGIGSKFALRIRGKHLFNPACCAIVTLLGTHLVWVSPGQWGAWAWGVGAVACAACLVLSRARRLDTAAAFLACWAALLAARCVSLGDPWTIPLHQMQSGALLVFAFFMVTDPRSTPDSAVGRVLFAACVAALGHLLQFRWQVREGLFYALITVALMTPVLDMLVPRTRFVWRPILQEV